MTGPYAAGGVGISKTPRDGTLRDGDGQSLTEVRPACSGRFERRHDRLPEHETAGEDEREAFAEPPGPTSTGPKPASRNERGGLSDRSVSAGQEPATQAAIECRSAEVLA